MKNMKRMMITTLVGALALAGMIGCGQDARSEGESWRLGEPAEPGASNNTPNNTSNNTSNSTPNYNPDEVGTVWLGAETRGDCAHRASYATIKDAIGGSRLIADGASAPIVFTRLDADSCDASRRGAYPCEGVLVASEGRTMSLTCAHVGPVALPSGIPSQVERSGTFGAIPRVAGQPRAFTWNYWVEREADTFVRDYHTREVFRDEDGTEVEREATFMFTLRFDSGSRTLSETLKTFAHPSIDESYVPRVIFDFYVEGGGFVKRGAERVRSPNIRWGNIVSGQLVRREGGVLAIELSGFGDPWAEYLNAPGLFPYDGVRWALEDLFPMTVVLTTERPAALVAEGGSLRWVESQRSPCLSYASMWETIGTPCLDAPLSGDQGSLP